GGMRLEIAESCAQRAPLQCSETLVIHTMSLPQSRDFIVLAKIGGVEFGDFLRINVKRVEEQPAVRRIWTAIFGPVIEQDMQRVKTDSIGSEVTGQFDQCRKIGEIADAPVAR